MLPEVVIDRQVAGQPAVAFLRVWERHDGGPLAAGSLDVDEVGRRPYRSNLAVGSGPVEPGTDVP